MSIVSQKAITKALNSRKKPSKVVALEDFLFDQQLAFVKDPRTFKVGVCSRRAGKTTGIAADLVQTAISTPDCTALYITGSRASAKKIIWDEILKFNRVHSLGGVPNIAELKMSFPNGSMVRLEGAKDDSEINKIRGQLPPVKKAFIDEAQSIRDSVLITLIDDVLEAALLDYAGSLILIGTPGAIKAGYFYRICHNLDEYGNPLDASPWSIHAWTFFDNPFIAKKSKLSHDELLTRVLKRRGVTINHPSIQREFFGKWVSDTDSLLLHYEPITNDYKELPSIAPRKYNYVMGIDLGFDDADAIAVLGWSDDSPTTYLIEEIVVPQQGITELVAQIELLRKKYEISKMVIDQGGLGKKIAEELRRRHSIPVEAADKARKMENISFLNDGLRTGRFKANKSSKFAQDSYLVEIDKDKSTSDKIKVSDKYHSDIIDAVLYAYKLSPAYAYEPPAPKPAYGSKAWALAQQEDMFEATLEAMQADQASGDRIKTFGWSSD